MGSYRLLPWQKELADWIVENTPRSLIIGKGRRAGWTVMFQYVEEEMKRRGWQDGA